jgi:hypothetical protein
MNRQRWLMGVGVGLVLWTTIGVGVAEGQTIPPVGANGLPLTTDANGSPITVAVSLFQGGVNVTSTWLPEPLQPVTISVTVGGVAVTATIKLVCPDGTLVDGTLVTVCPVANAAFNPIASTPPLVRTSAYPGVCTNTGVSTDLDFLSADFTFNPLTNELMPMDCGGMAVIQVSDTGLAGEPFTFVLPRDSDFDGIPDIYEARFCPAESPNCLEASADADSGVSVSAPTGDGLAAFDEYRGFMVSGKHVRTDPTQKDLFLHLVNTADCIDGFFVGRPTVQCGTSYLSGGAKTYPVPTAPNATLEVPLTATTPGAIVTFTTGNSPVFGTAHVRGEIVANGVGRARIVSVTSATSATAEVIVPFAGTALAPGQWKVAESIFATVYSLVPPERVHLIGHVPDGTNRLTTEWVDSLVSFAPSQNLTIPTTTPPDRTVNPNRLYGPVQRGVRVMEGLNLDNPSTLGWAYGVASPNTAGNIVVFTQRIINYITGLITDGGSSIVRYSTFVNGVWTTPKAVPDDNPTMEPGDGAPGNQAVRDFILSKAMQYYVGMEVGHSLDLTPTIIETNRTSYGYHYAPFTGDCLDQALTVKLKSGFNTFYIASLCGTTDQSQFLISP